MPPFAAALTSPRTRATLRGWAELRRRITGQPHRVLYFHQVDDPYSHLVVQRLPAFAAQYQIDLQPRLVGPPPDDAAPDRDRLVRYARKDAGDIAAYLDLEMPAAGDLAETDRAASILAAAIRDERFLDAAPDVGRALFSGEGLGDLEERYGAASPQWADDERRRLGHYLGGTFYYGGEWYWGLDRLHFLEARLTELGLAEGSPSPVVRFPSIPDQPASERVINVEAFVSMRSPYSYLSLAPLYRLRDALRFELNMRPVLPMVMRGLAVPRMKRMYILQDANREAARLGVPFGRVSDPLGDPIIRLYQIFASARRAGGAERLLLEFGRGAWAEGLDVGSKGGLRTVIERAGLDPAQMDVDPDWEAEIERNRQAMLDAGVWGVPSFVIRGEGEPDFVTWGQDRLWLLGREILRRQAASPASKP